MVVKKAILLDSEEKEILTKARIILGNIWEEMETNEADPLYGLLSFFDDVNDTYNLGLDY